VSHRRLVIDAPEVLDYLVAPSWRNWQDRTTPGSSGFIVRASCAAYDPGTGDGSWKMSYG